MQAKTNHFTQNSTVMLILWYGLSTPAHPFAGGKGTPEDPYQIATVEQLVSIGADPNLLDKHYVLLNDLDLDPNLPGGQMFTRAVIAPDVNLADDFQGTAFTGGFDGGGHVIRNLTILRGTEADSPRFGSYLGLFGKLGKGAIVSDLAVETARVGLDYAGYVGLLAGWNEGRIVRCHVEGRASGHSYVGGLVGDNRGDIHDCDGKSDFVGSFHYVGGLVGINHAGARIVRCHAASEVLVQQAWAGGLVGLNGGYLIGCYATGEVSGPRYIAFVGGLVGLSHYPGVIVNCHASGNVLTWERGPYAQHVGGLVGDLRGATVGELGAGTSIINCYATGNVSGGDNSISLGGLVGCVGRRSDGVIVNSYAVGKVSAGKDSTYVGGLIGDGTYAQVKASFWDVETSGLSESGGGIGLTTAQMQDIGQFLAAGWDFVDERGNGTADVWMMPEEGGYPVLALLSQAYDPPQLAGSGTPDDPFRIATAEDVGAAWHHDPTACYELTGDIDLSGITWAAAPIPAFYGTFDGAGFIISHLAVRGLRQLGLFGALGTEAIVTNLGVAEANIASEDRGVALGILAGENYGGYVSGCYATGSVAGGRRSLDLGGLLGLNSGSIADCYAIADVSGDEKSSHLGGLVGISGGSVTHCYAAGRVTAPDPNETQGGLLGTAFEVTIDSSYFLAPTDGGGPDNGAGLALTDTQMKQQASFAGWDFENIWMICEGKDYPRLRWEGVPCGERVF